MRFLAFTSVLLGVFLDNLLFNVLIPVLPFYAETLQLSHRELGWLISSYTLALLATVFVSGILTDRFGAAKTFLAGSALLVFAAFLLKISDSYPMMIAARLLQGVSAGFTWVAGFSYVARHSAPGRAGRNLIILQSGMGVAEFIGPVIGGFLYQWGGAALLFKALLAFALLNLVLRLVIGIGGDAPAEESSRIDLSPLRDRKILRLALIYLCGGFLLSVGDPLLPVFLKHQFAFREGAVSMAFLVITTAYYVLALPLTARYRGNLVIYSGVALSCVAFAATFIAHHNVVLLFSVLAVFGFATGLFVIPVVARVADAVAESKSESYGVAFSSGQWAYTLGMFIGPVASTHLAEHFSYFHSALVLAALPILLLLFLRRIG
ncbi:MAG: MFS transporter [Turneriella sp.]